MIRGESVEPIERIQRGEFAWGQQKRKRELEEIKKGEGAFTKGGRGGIKLQCRRLVCGDGDRDGETGEKPIGGLADKREQCKNI